MILLIKGDTPTFNKYVTAESNLFQIHKKYETSTANIYVECSSGSLKITKNLCGKIKKDSIVFDLQ